MSCTLKGKRILVIEDEYFIAMDIKRTLNDVGVDIVGPLSNIGQGLASASDDKLDAAILDLNLDGVMSFPLAERLAALGVPYLFLTGYDSWSLPHDFRAAPHVVKPFSSQQLIAAVEGLCGASAS
jgi:DNA-binding response OmpR family regulator